jgi:hypothetical protein
MMHNAVVRQRSTNDCGVAVVAMATGASYERVVEVAGRLPWRVGEERGLTLREVAWLLRRVGRRPWRWTDRVHGPPLMHHWWRGVAGTTLLQEGVVVLLRQAGDAWGHFVWAQGGWAGDPEQGLVPLACAYPRWQVARVCWAPSGAHPEREWAGYLARPIVHSTR